MPTKMSSEDLYQKLLNLNLQEEKAQITFEMAHTKVIINTTDTVGITIQSWLKQFMIDNDIFFMEENNTQKFPDFYLNDDCKEKHMLEIKAFNFSASPAFDIANFESYCDSVRKMSIRLDADYLIFGYEMDSVGKICIKKIWLKKIWQLAGTSRKFPIKTQVKRDMIYNIRPASEFKYNRPSFFSSKEEFISAIYQTLIIYKDINFAKDWLTTLSQNYKITFRKDLII